MSYCKKLLELNEIAVDLNIEGYKPSVSLPKGAKWYNIIQVKYEPLMTS